LEEAAKKPKNLLSQYDGNQKMRDLLSYKLMSNVNTTSERNRSNFSKKIQKLKLRGNDNLTIWSLHYLNTTIGHSIYNIHSELKKELHARLSGCKRISESMIASLLVTQTPTDSNLFNTAKVLIINDDNKNISATSIINILKNENDLQTNHYFKYLKIENKSKTFNFYECCESMSDIFQSERHLVIIPFNIGKESENDSNEASIIRRILKLLTRNTLPVKVLIAALTADKVASLSSFTLPLKIIEKLKKIEFKLKESIEEQMKSSADSTIQNKLRIGDQLNLMEQLKMIDKILTFMVLFDNGKESLVYNQNQTTSNDDKTTIKKNMNDAISKIDKKDIAEMKNLKSPPQSLKIVGEAICLLFSMKPEYSNFQKLLGDVQLFDKLNQFDFENVSETTTKRLDIYLNNPDEYNESKISQVSKGASHLFSWAKVIYDYSVAKQKKENIEGQFVSSPVTNLLDFVDKNSFYNIAWPLYYNCDDSFDEKSSFLKNNDKKFENISNLLKRSELDSQAPFLSIQEYIELFDNNGNLCDQLVEDKYSSFGEKYAKCENIKGNLLFNDSFIINDLKWLEKVIKTVSKVKNPIYKSAFSSTPLWNRNHLIQALKRFITDDSKIDELLIYLKSVNLIATLNDIIIPLNLLTDDVDKQKFVN
jgi:hypothetical protein